MESRTDGIVRVPGFSSKETSRPTVKMPPLVERQRPTPRAPLTPVRPSIDDAFDRSES